MQWPLERQPVSHLSEYRMAHDFLEGEQWLLGDLAPAEAAVDIRPNAEFLAATEDRDAKLASPLFDGLRRYEGLSLDRGVRIELRLGEAPIDGSTFDPAALDGTAPLFDVPAGYQMRALTSASRDAGLAYFRNVEPVQQGAYHWRNPAPRPFSLVSALPAGRYEFRVLNLADDTTERVTAEAPGLVLAERATTADFAVLFHRQ